MIERALPAAIALILFFGKAIGADYSFGWPLMFLAIWYYQNSL